LLIREAPFAPPITNTATDFPTAVEGANMMKKIEKVLSGIDAVVLWICAICIAVMVIYSFIDVSGRFLLNRPLYGTYELSGEILLVIVIYLSLSACESEGRHMRVDFIFSFISQKAKLVFDFFTYAFGIVVCALLIKFTMGPVLYSLEVREYTTGIIPFPVYPAKISIVLGLGLFLIRVAVRLVGTAKDFVASQVAPKISGPDISHASDQI
jgi:TRAP-type C4-dicarboxylate transport system permease small subunit